MKRFLIFIILLAIGGTFNLSFAQVYKNGDIIFIKNKEIKGKSIVPNGKSNFNYIGIIFIEKGIPMVYHSAEPFSKCSFDDFIGLSENKEFKIKYLSDEELLTNGVIESMHNYAVAKLGSKYDNALKLTNDNLYNAEFVWKIYQEGTGLELCIPREMKDYGIDNKATIEFLTESYGEEIFKEKIVSVGDIYQSQFLD